ncbi:hypothetical protein S7711_10915 [Stachybotrys chartarum IBT 7711]|uniref:Uncharacterized protein n=1 Tax=Stachybotrys chartarum (strain CBS 109288 / IBT 7711) TaxID=1280523 RepID=A0A084ARB1_STACB|nr:hypothetical protein S7711_10915 [Stachybotrys chartarum IBT 7711]
MRAHAAAAAAAATATAATSNSRACVVPAGQAAEYGRVPRHGRRSPATSRSSSASRAALLTGDIYGALPAVPTSEVAVLLSRGLAESEPILPSTSAASAQPPAISPWFVPRPDTGRAYGALAEVLRKSDRIDGCVRCAGRVTRRD